MRALEERKKLDELLAEFDVAFTRDDTWEMYVLARQMEKVGRSIYEKETGAYREEELAAAR